MKFSFITACFQSAAAFACCTLLCAEGAAQDSPNSPGGPPLTAPELSVAVDEAEQIEDSLLALERLVTKLIRENIPHTHEDRSKWGKTKRRWDGLHIQLDRFKLKTKRRWKDVNHGKWSMYRIQLLDPKEQLVVTLENMHETEDGRLEFDIYFAARVQASARTANWVKGVQLYSFNAEATAKMMLHVRGSVALKLGVSKFPPDVIVDANVSQADLRLDEFQLHRVSDVGGEFAQQLGRGVRKILEEKIKDGNQKLAAKLNRQIEKKKDKLRFSMHDLLKSKWSKLAKHVDKEQASDGKDNTDAALNATPR